LVKGGYDARDQQEKYRGGKQRHRDFEKLLQAGSAVNSRRLIVCLGYALQPGQQNHDTVAHARPYGNHAHAEHGEVRVRHPCGTYAKQRVQDNIDNSILRVQQPAPDHHHYGGHRHVWQEVDDSKEADRFDFGIHHRGKNHGHDQGKRHRAQHIDKRVAYLHAELGIPGKHFDVVVYADPLRCTDSLPSGERIVERFDNRHDKEQNDAHQQRQQEQKRREHFLAVVALAVTQFALGNCGAIHREDLLFVASASGVCFCSRVRHPPS